MFGKYNSTFDANSVEMNTVDHISMAFGQVNITILLNKCDETTGFKPLDASSQPFPNVFDTRGCVANSPTFAFDSTQPSFKILIQSSGGFGSTEGTSLLIQSQRTQPSQPGPSTYENLSGNKGFAPCIGTEVKFSPVIGFDTMANIKVNERYQCISMMKEYEGKSLEELRLDDYLIERNRPANTNLQIGNSHSSIFNNNISAISSPTGFDHISPSKGTTLKFSAICGRDTMLKNGVSIQVKTRHQCITVMKEYEGKSLEELRLDDYQVERNTPANTAIRTGDVHSSIFNNNISTISSRTGFDRMSPNKGTLLKFSAVSGTDIMLKNEVSIPIKTRHQCITAMFAYAGKCFEELRMEDYLFNRKALAEVTALSQFGSDNSQPSLFDTCTSTGYLSNQSPSPNAHSLGNSGFDGIAPSAGTVVKFSPVLGTDELKNGVCVDINTRNQCITAMKEFKGKSFEKLRLEDIRVNRKDSAQETALSEFGTDSSQMSLFNFNALPPTPNIPAGFSDIAPSTEKTVKFSTVLGTDTLPKNLDSIDISKRHQCITAYKDTSFEELRIDSNNLVNKKDSAQGTALCEFENGSFQTLLFKATPKFAANSYSAKLLNKSSRSTSSNICKGCWGSQPSGGTIINPTVATNKLVENETSNDISTRNQRMTVMNQYNAQNFEELRAGRNNFACKNDPAETTVSTKFGIGKSQTFLFDPILSATSTSSGIFGDDQNLPSFGSTNRVFNLISFDNMNNGCMKSITMPHC